MFFCRFLNNLPDAVTTVGDYSDAVFATAELPGCTDALTTIANGAVFTLDAVLDPSTAGRADSRPAVAGVTADLAARRLHLSRSFSTKRLLQTL